MFFIAMIVGLVEIAPGMCRMELLNPNDTIDTSIVKCADIVQSDLVNIHHDELGI